MAFPAAQKYLPAGMLVNQQIPFVSLLTTTGTYVTGITNHAIAQGYTCAGSSNGTTAAMDGVNRCTTAAGFAVRAANTTTAQSWIVITAANGAQTLFTFTGASDDIARISGSPGGLFVVAGTATFAPTATDEVVGITTVSLIGATASSNRVFNVQIDSAHNGWRAFIFRLGIVAAPIIFGELFDPAFIVGPGATCAVPVWWGCNSAGNLLNFGAAGSYSAINVGGSTRMVVNGTPMTVNMGGTVKLLALSSLGENNIPQELNANGFVCRSIGLSSATASAHGDVGRRYDWLSTNELKPSGELDATKTWINLNNASTAGAASGTLWTWDGASTAQTA